MTRDLVYGRNAVREALRGRRAVLEVWASERAVDAVEWLGEGPRPKVKRERELTEAAGSPDHQGIVAWCEPYPYADAWELAAADGRCSASSTRSPTRGTSVRWYGALPARARRASSSPRTAPPR